MQFGPLQTPQQIQKHFQQLKLQSRAQLIAEIYKHIPVSMHPESVEKDLTDAFCAILDGYSYDKASPIVRELTHLFGLEAIRRLPPEDHKSRVYEKILSQVEEKLKAVQAPEKEISHPQMDNPESHFEWVGASTQYPSLRAIFEEILLEKVKLFDAELTELTNFQQLKYHETEELLKMKTTDQVGKIRPSTAKVREIHRKIEGQFTDVLIRDKSEFTLKKWTAKEQGQFRSKKKHTLRINNVPVLFQFVKKYTQTVKARDNIYAKWEQRERTGITSEQLRYLCATSVFLNNSLNISEKKRIQGNIKSAGRALVSKLEFNIAEKIIETYKMLTRKVSDLRAKYYEQETEKRKLKFAQSNSLQKNNAKVSSRLEEFRKYEAMFRKILKGQRMQIKLRFNILRWVRLFISNLRRKINKKSTGNHMSRAFSSSTKSTPLLRRLKLMSPASKVIKREEDQSHRLRATRYLPSSRFQYEPSLEKTITALNSTRLPYHSSAQFKKHLTGGPAPKSDAIYVDLIRKKIQLTSTKCLRGVIAIQSKWRAVYYRKKYLERIKIVREQIKQDFARKIQSLRMIYPPEKRINMQAVKSRLARVHMQMSHILQPYVRVIRRQIHTYTSFCVGKLSLPQLKLKHARNGVIRLGEFGTFVMKNQYNLLKKSGLVVTSKEINDPIYKNQASAIWWAVKHSNLELTTTLLQGGGDPNSADAEGNTCLHLAIRNGGLKIIFALLDYGGDLNFRNKQKVTPLFYATERMLSMLGLQDGNAASMGQNSKDNNGLFFKTRVPQEDIYRQHFF